MIIEKQRGHRRSGAAVVETAFILIPLMMFIFGVFEYSRLFMDWNLLNNAAREGCRYALVNNTSATISTDVSTVVNKFMAGETKNFTSFTVTVSGMHSGSATTVNNLAAGDLITVTVTGNYNFLNVIPFLPKFAALPITSSVTMVCEGVT